MARSEVARAAADAPILGHSPGRARLAEPPSLTRRFPTYQRACLVALVFLVPVVVDVRLPDAFETLKITAIWYAAAVVGALALSYRLTSRRSAPKSKVLRAAALLVAVCLVSAALSSARIVTVLGVHQRFGGLIPLLSYVAVAALVAVSYWRGPDAVTYLFLAATAGSTVVSGYALIQAAGLDWASWFDKTVGTQAQFPGSTIGNSNFAGGCIAIAIPLFLPLLVSSGLRRWRPILAAMLGLNVVALWFTHARGAMVAVAVAAFVALILVRRHLPRWAKRALVAAPAFTLAIGLGALLHPGLSHAPPPFEKTSTRTLGYRMGYWVTGLRIFSHHPVFGTGPDTYYAYYGADRTEHDALENPDEFPDEPHNIFVGYLSNTGFLGFAAFCAVATGALWCGVRAARAAQRQRLALLVAATTAFAAYLVQGFFSIDEPPLAFMGWVLVGVLVVLAEPSFMRAREVAVGGRESPTFERNSARLAHRLVHVAVWSTAALLLAVATCPLLADQQAKRNSLATAAKLNRVDSSYQARAGDIALTVASATVDPAQRLTQLQLAVKSFRQALRRQPRQNRYLLQLASANTLWARTIDPMRFPEAERWWAKALQADPKNVSIANDHRRAVEDMRAIAVQAWFAALASPSDAQSWIAAGQAAFAVGDTVRARSAAERALTIDTQSEPAHRILQALPPGARG